MIALLLHWSSQGFYVNHGISPDGASKLDPFPSPHVNLLRVRVDLVSS